MSSRGGRPYSPAERAAIARGEFFTAAELAARPWLGKTVIASELAKQPGQPADPNTRPMTRAERAAVDAMVQVCGYCHEPGDDKSAIGDDGMHPECATAWKQERAAR